MGRSIAVDDDQKDVAIIEASALLATLVFIILTLYMSHMAEMAALVGALEPFTYAVGFFFVMAALAATIHLFKAGSTWLLAAVRILEIAFFMSGLGTLAVMFFFRAPRDLYTFVVLVVITLFAIVISLVYGHHYGRLRSLEPL